ncbi:39S mitochondrial ribosomal protein L46-domain-containing protein [Staphylotrichum tortipilum]|uniref:Large ribosomal subunit protein mL46 n=1 Tax=Staphylotrichum tortipilum TaxID=2831512 RepID=A0AAN6MJJ3_9PEZI|nr:39S mitochondrial ribosomal protein L46-domain-containing protein [Staphylotrichum longicolle]
MSAPGRGLAKGMLPMYPSSTSSPPQDSRPPLLPRPPPLPTRRLYSAQAAAPAEPSQPTTPPPPPPSTAPSPATPNPTANYRIRSGVILTRAPLLTRDPTPFESAFYLYQKRLNERLTGPFRQPFYYKKDTAADLDFRIKLRERRGVPAKDIGRYNPKSRMAWNDEVMLGSTTSDPELIREKLVADAEVRISEDGEPIAPEDRIPVEKPMPRRTEADEKNDVRRLDRALDRTLYLVVKKGGKGEEGVWEFPTDTVPAGEVLHETAARALRECAGVNMNTWFVGKVPVAHHVAKPAPGAAPETGEKVFFLKGRIMAGQANLAGNTAGATDFQWLTQEELQIVLAPEYYHSVRGMMELR